MKGGERQIYKHKNRKKQNRRKRKKKREQGSERQLHREKEGGGEISEIDEQSHVN